MVRIESIGTPASAPSPERGEAPENNPLWMLPSPKEANLDSHPPQIGADSPLRDADPRSILAQEIKYQSI